VSCQQIGRYVWPGSDGTFGFNDRLPFEFVGVGSGGGYATFLLEWFLVFCGFLSVV
jgi:hypothetical protein